MYSQITSHLETHHPLSSGAFTQEDQQSLLCWKPLRFQFMDTEKEVGAVFFDLQMAFDSVLHHALLKKLRDLQLNEFLLK